MRDVRDDTCRGRPWSCQKLLYSLPRIGDSANRATADGGTLLASESLRGLLLFEPLLFRDFLFGQRRALCELCGSLQRNRALVSPHPLKIRIAPRRPRRCRRSRGSRRRHYTPAAP
jgi:hypothetical protein